jgi:poly(3-hydroxybutyrate) depolymerase
VVRIRVTKRHWTLRPSTLRWSVIVAFAAGVAVLVALLLAGPPAITTSTVAVSPASSLRRALEPKRLLIRYTAWDGRQRLALVVLPGSDDVHGAPLPLVISPHGRGVTPAEVASRWGDLPTRYRFAVVCPAGEGVHVHDEPFGAPGDVADLARMPYLVHCAVPLLRIDRRHVYVVGSSMGGMEALLLAARYPRSVAAAVAMDPVVDLTRRYCQMAFSHRSGDPAQDTLVRELGGTPSQVPDRYRARSPLAYVAALARGHVPLQIWWSRTDMVVVGQASSQSGRLFRALMRLNSHAPVSQVVTDLSHNTAFSARVGLPAVMRFLRPHGRWLERRPSRRRGRPRAGLKVSPTS